MKSCCLFWKLFNVFSELIRRIFGTWLPKVKFRWHPAALDFEILNEIKRRTDDEKSKKFWTRIYVRNDSQFFCNKFSIFVTNFVVKRRKKRQKIGRRETRERFLIDNWKISILGIRLFLSLQSFLESCARDKIRFITKIYQF